MYKKILLIPCFLSALLLTSCGLCKEISNSNCESVSSNTKYKIGITNDLGEQYIVEYEKYNGFPNKRMKIKIFESEKLIISYWSEFNDNYIPNEILYLFTENNCEYYFVADTVNDFVVLFGNEIFESHGNQLFINVDYSEIKSTSDYLTLSQKIRDNVNKEELVDKFKTCNYDDSNIVKLYDFSDFNWIFYLLYIVNSLNNNLSLLKNKNLVPLDSKQKLWYIL